MPPGAPEGAYLRWDDCGVWTQAQLIEYDRVRHHDDNTMEKTDSSRKIRPARIPKRRR